MKFVIIVTAIPGSSGAQHAYQFCSAALANNHTVLDVFFYANGCWQVAWLEQPNEQTVVEQHQQAWLKLKQQHALTLHFCSSAVSNRGLEHQRTLPLFQTSSLAQLVQATSEADRVITFG